MWIMQFIIQNNILSDHMCELLDTIQEGVSFADNLEMENKKKKLYWRMSKSLKI